VVKLAPDSTEINQLFSFSLAAVATAISALRIISDANFLFHAMDAKICRAKFYFINGN
jgi:hypothetical protein